MCSCGYIAYCQKEGIISGYADGTFKPAAPLTGYAFMKMLLGARGYDANVEGYTGTNKIFAGATYNSDGIITSFVNVDSATLEKKDSVKGSEKVSGEYTIKLAGTPYTVDEDANIWTVNNDSVITVATLSDLKTDANNYVACTKEDGEGSSAARFQERSVGWHHPYQLTGLTAEKNATSG